MTRTNASGPPKPTFTLATPDSYQEWDALTAALTDAFRFPTDRADGFYDVVGRSNMRMIVRQDDGTVCGGLALVRMGQWFGGQAVPMTGIVAVGIGAGYRSQGAAGSMMAQMLQELHATGETPISTLYPATRPLYRRAGYESAGHRFKITMPLRHIETRDRSLSVRPLPTAGDEPDGIPLEVKALYREQCQPGSGQLDRGPYIWARVAKPRGRETVGYGIYDDDAATSLSSNELLGYVYYCKTDSRTRPYSLEVSDMAFLTPAAGRRILALMADHRSMADTVTWWGSPADPMLELETEKGAEIQDDLAWMLRIVDVKKALEARGYPLGVNAEIPIEVFGDTVLPDENNRRWLLQVADGKATVVRNRGKGIVRLHINGLAALYSGYRSVSDLEQMGLLFWKNRYEDARSDVSQLIRSVFACPMPWMSDQF
ncbi:MAG: GNAT family N-acetyltransferase [Planctomycetes bacterium]|nr:GNAT family N-acetyltransferase [Planctomycetota bacterium]